MSGGLIVIILALVVVAISVASSRGGEGASRGPKLAIILAALAALGAVGLFFLYRKPGA